MSLMQLFKKKQRIDRLPRVIRAVELLITEQEMVKISRDKDLDYDFDHMKDAVKYGKLLADKRKIDPDIACIACAMQNVGRIKSGKSEAHALSGYPMVKQMLAGMRCFEPSEMEQIATAVQRHSDKEQVHTPLDELVKDVDIYVRYVDGYSFTRPCDIRRLNKLKLEFHLKL